jgi:hypothetical protein
MSTNFFTNENENSLFRKFNGAFENITNFYALHVSVRYFKTLENSDIGGYLLKAGFKNTGRTGFQALRFNLRRGKGDSAGFLAWGGGV